LFIFNKD